MENNNKIKKKINNKQNVKVVKTEKTVLKSGKKALENKKSVKRTIDKKKIEKIKNGITGIVVSTKMQKTIVVSVTRKVAHKKYGKLIKITKKLKADTNGMEFVDGDTVTIKMGRPMSKGKNYIAVRKEETAS